MFLSDGGFEFLEFLVRAVRFVVQMAASRYLTVAPKYLSLICISDTFFYSKIDFFVQFLITTIKQEKLFNSLRNIPIIGSKYLKFGVLILK